MESKFLPISSRWSKIKPASVNQVIVAGIAMVSETDSRKSSTL